MKVYNTVTRKKEEFVPLTPGEVRMYVCGVTPYDYSHIGHARSAMVFDVVRRYLTFRGFRVKMVRNYTDVDDKIIKRANQEGVPADQIAQRYIAAEIEDMASLGVMAPDVAPRATEHIPAMVAWIERLVAKQVAYVLAGDVYFEIRRFPPYGRLSGKNLDELLAGARVEVDERKRDPRDFALWKAAKPGEPSWPSPWGPGRPGWHIECSVMSIQYLGETFDIHGGGSDLIFPHHECEIAQAEAETGKTFSRFWLHNGMLNLGAEKMSKSLGNTLTIKEFVKRHDPQAIRFWLLGTHYRHPVDFGEERVREASRALERLWGPVEQTRALPAAASGPEGSPAPPAEFVPFRDRFVAAMDDDFNTPQAIGVLFELASALNANPGGRAPAEQKAGARELARLASVLGLSEPAQQPVPAVVERLVAERLAARTRREWKRSDELRDEIRRHGWTVEDTPAGPRVARTLS